MARTINSYDEFVSFCALLSESDFSDYSIGIVVEVPNVGLFRRINEDYFYKTEQEGEITDTDEINVSLGNVSIKYVLTDGE